MNKKIVLIYSVLLGFCGTPLTCLGSYLASNTKYIACFTPQQNCTKKIANLIKYASKEIEVQAYLFTSYDIAYALARAERRGIKVKVILDKEQLTHKPISHAILILQHAHIPIWIDNKVQIAHNKVIIIDQKIIETGSFNFTYSAQNYNAENILILFNRTLALKYLKNWQLRLSKSTALKKQL